MNKLTSAHRFNALALLLTAALSTGQGLATTAPPTPPLSQITTKGAPMTQHDLDTQHILWGHWLDLWNGKYALAPEIIAPTFRLHAELLDGSSDTTINSPEHLVGWMTQTAAPFEAFTFTTLVGPIIDGPYVVGRWVATGKYQGGIPGAKAAPGTVVSFAGTDILRVQDGKIVEYWLSSDTSSLLAQLKIGMP